jgi:hypothetical protein
MEPREPPDRLPAAEGSPVTGRTWKRIGLGLAIALVAFGAVHYWRRQREERERAVLLAEILAERAARPRIVEPEPTEEEHETAEMYLQVLVALKPSYDETDLITIEFYDAIDAAPWPSPPVPITRALEGAAKTLTLLDAAVARNACRFAEAGPVGKSGASGPAQLLAARGHAALAMGRPLAAAEDVRRLLRVGRDLASAPFPGGAEEGWPWPDVHLLNAEEEAARLLSALATAPDLPSESASSLLSAAQGPWGTSDAIRRRIAAHPAILDSACVTLLSPGGKAFLAESDRQQRELAELLQGSSQRDSGNLFDRVQHRLREALPPATAMPTAAEIRMERAAAAEVQAAMERRDLVALAPDGPLEASGKKAGLLSPFWFRESLRDEARIAVARAAAAVRAFQLTEGRPPTALRELVPGVISEEPLDPFDGKPMDYAVDGQGWRITSRVWKGRNGPKQEGKNRPMEPVEVRFTGVPK